jgi:hypothetical protein
MTGKSLKSLAGRSTENMMTRLKDTSYNDKGGTHESLYDFIKVHMFHASVTAMFGKQLFEADPDFCHHFREFEEGMPELAKGLPRFIYRKKYRARENCLQTVRKWQRKLDQQRAAGPGCGRAVQGRLQLLFWFSNNQETTFSIRKDGDHWGKCSSIGGPSSSSGRQL